MASIVVHTTLHGIFPDHLDDRVEQVGIDLDAEIENGEHQHDAGGRELRDAFGHHRAELFDAEAGNRA
ncbi:hypothetical protein [Rhizobium ruizarguesonis]|uniref:hypothetical protein n=1 Tax=Rhizobium ruizarguesonis TaxID=2081791 RepID=UPI0037131A98